MYDGTESILESPTVILLASVPICSQPLIDCEFCDASNFQEKCGFIILTDADVIDCDLDRWVDEEWPVTVAKKLPPTEDRNPSRLAFVATIPMP